MFEIWVIFWSGGTINLNFYNVEPFRMKYNLLTLQELREMVYISEVRFKKYPKSPTTQVLNLSFD